MKTEDSAEVSLFDAGVKKRVLKIGLIVGMPTAAIMLGWYLMATHSLSLLLYCNNRGWLSNGFTEWFAEKAPLGIVGYQLALSEEEKPNLWLIGRGSKAIRYYISVFSSGNEGTKIRVLHCLGRMGEGASNAIEFLASEIQNQALSSEIRAAVVVSLSCIGGDAAILEVERCLGHDDKFVRLVSATLLQVFTIDGVSPARRTQLEEAANEVLKGVDDEEIFEYMHFILKVGTYPEWEKG